MTIGIYKITNKVNGKFYIGSSKDIEKRWNQHVRALRKQYHHSIFLQRAWDKYGENNFYLEVVEETSEDLLLETEQKYLDELFDVSYNVSKTSSGGDIISYHPNRNEIAQKIKKAIKERWENMTDEEYETICETQRGERNGMYGKKHSEEMKQKLRNERLGKPNLYLKGIKWALDDPRRKGLSESKKLLTGEKNPFFGRQHTKETIERIVEKNKKHYQTLSLEDLLKNKQIRFVLIEGALYPGVACAARYLGVVAGTIVHRIKSKNPKYKNYEYIDDESTILSLLDILKDYNPHPPIKAEMYTTPL